MDTNDAASGIVKVLFVLAIGLLSLMVYLPPTWVAVVRGARNTGSIVVINLLLGWLLIPWVIALAMAFGDTRPRPPEWTRCGLLRYC